MAPYRYLIAGLATLWACSMKSFVTELQVWFFRVRTSTAPTLLAVPSAIAIYWNVTVAIARLTLSCGQTVTGPGAVPGVATLVP